MLAAILPIGLRDLLRRLPQIVERLDDLDDERRPRQVPRFRDRFCPIFAEAAARNCQQS